MIIPAAESYLKVSEVVEYIKACLDNDPILPDLTIAGEVFNYKHSAQGHRYFTLRDAKASIKCVMFRAGRGGAYISEGAQVLVDGAVSLYAAKGDLQLYARSVKAHGTGTLQQAIDALKQRLAEEGLFEDSRKRDIPAFPRRIAIITSASSAALQDILKVLKRRYPLGEVYVAHATVQGQHAAASIEKAFQLVERVANADVYILARGGGSFEDLMPFNEEKVARAIFACSAPVISGVGHETDTTIADLTADLRAPTPSAAAELATPNIEEIVRTIISNKNTLHVAINSLVGNLKADFDMAVDRLSTQSPNPAESTLMVRDLLNRAANGAERLFESKRHFLERITAHLYSLNPDNILKRGYAIASKEGATVWDSAELLPGDKLTVKFAMGSAETKVEKVAH